MTSLPIRISPRPATSPASIIRAKASCARCACPRSGPSLLPRTGATRRAWASTAARCCARRVTRMPRSTRSSPKGSPMPAERGKLREILIVEQDKPALKRRWFESDYFDLFAWQDLSGAFVKFQLCYDVDLDERALAWDGKGGFYHDGVDHGGTMAPILVPGGKLDSGTVVPRFVREAADIPA